VRARARLRAPVRACLPLAARAAARERRAPPPSPPRPPRPTQIGELWRALPVEEKAVYEKMAAEAKTAFVLANPGAKGVKKAPKPDGEKRVSGRGAGERAAALLARGRASERGWLRRAEPARRTRQR